MTNRGSTVALVAMIIGAVIMVYPYAFMLGSSFKTRKEFAEDRQSLLPARYQPAHILAAMRGEESARDWPGADWPLYQNYVDAIRYGQVDRYLANSFIYAVLITGAQLFFNALAAYAFARMAFRGRDLLFALLLSTMMVPPAVLLVPNFIVVRDLGLVDTLWRILLPGFAGAFGVFRCARLSSISPPSSSKLRASTAAVRGASSATSSCPCPNRR